MKLRLHGSSLRLRLTQPEVERIARAELVESVTHFPGGQQLSYSITVAEQPATTVQLLGGHIDVRLPHAIAGQWAKSDQVSIAVAVSAGDYQLELLIEKDFTCLHPRAEDEGLATFPNPNAPS